MNVFDFRQSRVNEYAEFTSGCTGIKADDTRDELRYIHDPADVMGVNDPTETFRVLKNREMREFGKYRTQRPGLVA